MKEIKVKRRIKQISTPKTDIRKLSYSSNKTLGVTNIDNKAYMPKSSIQDVTSQYSMDFGNIIYEEIEKPAEAEYTSYIRELEFSNKNYEEPVITVP